ncbi:MAG: histidinol dehydrogenase [candidate division FCPU426 bacterium]
MRRIDLATPAGKKQWRQLVLRQSALADPLAVRRDERTLRAFGRPMSAREAVAGIITAVRSQGDRAVLKYERLLDGWQPARAALKVSESERRAAAKLVPRALRQALATAAGHIRAFHRSQQSRPGRVARPGARVSERRLPLDRVGVYVPGGMAPLVSTVLMNALPARVAGVREVLLATPPGRGGRVLPALLYAADLAGVDVVYRLGGAVAVAAFAYGTETVPAVDKIVGPANVFGTEAKRQVVGQVGIDSLAGPSEILILADDSARPDQLAWDLLAQAEHGSGAVALLLTPSRQLLAAVATEIRCIAAAFPGLNPAGLMVAGIKTRDLREAAALAEEYAPEHLSLQTRQPRQWLARIRRVGAAFLGPMTAQALGDYIAGSNHVLPTNGTARWSSALSVRDFERHTSVVEFTSQGVKREGPPAVVLAEAEGLRAHAASMIARLRGRKA